MPQRRFLVQVWDKDIKLAQGNIVDAYDIIEEEELNNSHTFKFKLPTSSSSYSLISYRKIVRLIDLELSVTLTGVLTIDSVDNRQITLASTIGIAVGDYLLIFDSNTIPTKSFVAKVTAKSGDQVTLSRLDFTPTAGTSTGTPYSVIDGDVYSSITSGMTYAELLALGNPFVTTTGSPVIKWTGKTFRIWNIEEDREDKGVQFVSVTCQDLSYDLNDRYYIVDGRTSATFGLASMQNVPDSIIDPEEILDNILTAEPRSFTDFRNGFIKGTVDTFLTDVQTTTISAPNTITTVASPIASLKVVGVGTSFLSIARKGTILLTTTNKNAIAIVDYVVSDTELWLNNYPQYSVTSAIFQTFPDKRTYTFDTSQTLRSAILKIAETWDDENQSIHITFNEDKSIDIDRVPYPDPADPTSDAEIRVKKNLLGSKRRLDVSKFGNSILPQGASSSWLNANTGIFLKVGADPTSTLYHRNSKDKFLLDDRYKIRHLRWGDPIDVLHRPIKGDVTAFIDDSTIEVEFTVPAVPTGSTIATGGSVVTGTTYYFKVSAILNGEETPASAEGTHTIGDSGSDNVLRITYTNVAGATKHRIYISTTSQVYTFYYEDTVSFFDYTGGTGTSGVPKDIEGDSYINGLLLVYDFNAAQDYDAETGVGQVKTIESMRRQGPITNNVFTIKVTSPFEIIPSDGFEVLLSKPQNSNHTIIKGFGVMQNTASTFTNQIADATDKFKGQMTDVVTTDTLGVSATGSTGAGLDIFYDHYTGGLVYFNHGKGSAAGEAQTKFSGQHAEIVANSRANEAIDSAALKDLTLKFHRIDLTDTGTPSYLLIGPPQLVKEFKDTNYTLTAVRVTSPLTGLKLTVSGATKFTSSSSTTFDSTDYSIKDAGTTDLSTIDENMEIYVGSTFVGIVSGKPDFVNRKIYTRGAFLGAPANGSVFTCRLPSPDFHHETTAAYEGNMFSFIPHRNLTTGTYDAAATIYGFCYIADARQTPSGGTEADWGSGADSATQEGIGHGLRISNTTSGLNANELYLEWTGVAAGTTYTLKWIILVRPNLYTYVSVEAPQNWKFEPGDYVVLLNAETGAPLTVGKSLNNTSYVYGIDTGSLGVFQRLGLTKRAIPIKEGDGVKFVDSGTPMDVVSPYTANTRIYIGARAVESAITFSTRRGDQRLGQIAEVDSVVMGQDLTPTRPFDILKLKHDLDILPQPGDRVERLTIQDKSSIDSYGRVELQSTFSDIADPVELGRLARAVLRQSKDPLPRYEISALDYNFHDPNGRFVHEAISVGDTVRVVDDDFNLDRDDFKLIKITRNIENPISTVIVLENFVKDIQRGFARTTTNRLLKLENLTRLQSAQLDAPICIHFDTRSRRCTKKLAPNTFCNTLESGRDGRLTRNNDRISKFHCPSFTPATNDAMRDKLEVVGISFTILQAETYVIKTFTSPSGIIPNSKISDQDSDNIPEPVVILANAYYTDPFYNTSVNVANDKIVVTLERDVDGNILTQESQYGTGIQARFTRSAAPAYDIYCEAYAMIIGRYN